MYTCKDCLNRDKCKDENKRFELSKDGDSYAFYCDGFAGCEPHEITYNGYIVRQDSRFGVYVYEEQTRKLQAHFLCTAYQSDEELKDFPRFLEGSRKYMAGSK